MNLYKTAILFSFISANLFAQEVQEKETKELFNRWSLELNVGQNKPVRPFSEGYYSSKSNNFFNTDLQHYDFGVRYMFSNVFGLKLDVAYDAFSNQKNSGSLDFDSEQYRIGIQGVANIGRMLRFETFTQRFGLLAHAGIQVSQFTPKEGINKDKSEKDGGIIIGLTPQFRLTKWLVLTGDFSALSNVRQHYNWDGTFSAKDNNLSGFLYNTSLGFTFYFDKNQTHADWYIPENSALTSRPDLEARERIDAIEILMNDTDKDGVADYLDSQNNTPAGVTVDTHGRFIDTNMNGVPDEMERKANRADQKTDINDNTSINNSLSNSHSISVLKSLVENGNMNIFFDVNKDTPNGGSSNSIQQLYLYLMKYPESKIKLIGYADVRGDEGKNKDLSQRRALNLKNFFITSGIAENRITIGGQGVDRTYPTTTKTGLDLARRVSVELIK